MKTKKESNLPKTGSLLEDMIRVVSGNGESKLASPEVLSLFLKVNAENIHEPEYSDLNSYIKSGMYNFNKTPNAYVSVPAGIGMNQFFLFVLNPLVGYSSISFQFLFEKTGRLFYRIKWGSWMNWVEMS